MGKTIQLQAGHKCRSVAEDHTQRVGYKAQPQNREANQGNDHALCPENQRHCQSSSAADKQNAGRSFDKKLAELMGCQGGSGDKGQNKENTNGNEGVGKNDQRCLNQLGDNDLQSGNTDADGNLNGFGAEVIVKGLDKIHSANEQHE